MTDVQDNAFLESAEYYLTILGHEQKVESIFAQS